jgi:hypothetical protein
MQLKPSELAKRLGIAPAAVRDAERRGRLVREADGTYDTDRPENRSYLGRFTGHRGKQRTEPSSPARAAAMIARARSLYERHALKFKQRKLELIPADLVNFRLGVLLQALREEVAALADRIDLTATAIEGEMERAISEALGSAKKKSLQAAMPAHSETREAAVEYPDVLPDGASLDDARAFIDQVQADRIAQETALQLGEFVTRHDALRHLGIINSEVFGNLRTWPRRSVARVAAARTSQGAEAARRVLGELVEEELARIDEAVRRGRFSV